MMENWCGLVFALLVITPVTSANCTDDQIQKYLTSSGPPWSNYHRISQAVYPPTQLPSLLIKIQVKFVNESSPAINSTDACDLGPRGSDQNYTWSMSCLYVSGGHISMFTMRVSSLGTIWPERRQAELCVKLPQKCRRDLEKEGKMKYFLSKLQSVAIRPTAPDPSHNTARCVTQGHGKASFIGIKAALCGVCWSLLVAALLLSLVASWVLMYKLEKTCEIDEKVEAVQTAAKATEAAVNAVAKLNEATASCAELKTAEATAAAADKAAQRVNAKSMTAKGSAKAAEAATKAAAAAAAAAVAASNIIAVAEREETEEAAKLAKLATLAKATSSAAKEATAAAATAAKEATTKARVYATKKATQFILWVSTLVDICLIIASFVHFHSDGCLILYTIIVACMLLACACLKKWVSDGRKISSWCNIVVYPSLFIVIHHLLWVFLGIITEPLWALPVLVAISSVSFSLYYLAHTYRQASPGKLDLSAFQNSVTVYFFLSFSSLCLILFNVTLVGQAFFSESWIAAFAQSILVLVITAWVKYVDEENTI